MKPIEILTLVFLAATNPVAKAGHYQKDPGCEKVLDGRSSTALLIQRWKTKLEGTVRSETNCLSTISRELIYDNPEFEAIVDNGIAALPDILENLEQTRMLKEGFFRITKWRYELIRTGATPSDFRWTPVGCVIVSDVEQWNQRIPDPVSMCKTWWSKWRFETDKFFSDYLDDLKLALRTTNHVTETNALQNIRNLGLPVLPFLVERYSEYPQFLPIIGELTDRTFPSDTTPLLLSEWWETNKTRYSLPAPTNPPNLEK